MPSGRFFRRASAWIALFATVVAALAPTVSRAVAPEFLPGFICSAHGILPDPGRAPDPADRTAALKHCLFCAAQHDSLAPLLPDPVPALPSFAALRLAGTGAVTRPSLSVASNARARAPPAVS